MGVLPFPIDAPCSAGNIGRRIADMRNILYTRQLQHFLLEQVILSIQIAFQRYVQKIVLIITQVLCPDIAHLFGYDDGADYEHDGDHKLKDHQPLAEQQIATTQFQTPFQYAHRPERRKEQCRIAAGDKAGEKRNTQNARPESSTRREGDMLFRERVKGGQQHRQQQQGHRHGNKSQHHGLSHKLPDQRDTHSSHHLPHPYFFCTLGAPGGGNVHKVDTGYQQDKDRYDAEEADVFDATAFQLPLFVESIVQIHFIPPLDRQLHRISLIIMSVLVEKMDNLAAKFRRVGPLLQHDITIDPRIPPTLHMLMSLQEKFIIDDIVELTGCIVRHIFKYTRDLHRQAVIYL